MSNYGRDDSSEYGRGASGYGRESEAGFGRGGGGYGQQVAGYGRDGSAPGYGGYGGQQEAGYGRDESAPGYGGYGGQQEPGQGYGGSGYGQEAGGYGHQSGYGRGEQGADYGRQETGGYGHGYEEQQPEYGRRPASRPQHGAAEVQGQVVKIFCEAGPDYYLTVKNDDVVLTRGDESNDQQQFVKDCTWGIRVKDSAGFPAFGLVHKASGLALTHGSDANEKVSLKPYDPKALDESVLWTESDDVGSGYRCLRPVGNIHLNLDAKGGDQKHGGSVRDGTELILFQWKKQENQKWKIIPINDAGAGAYEEQGYGGPRPGYSDY